MFEFLEQLIFRCKLQPTQQNNSNISLGCPDLYRQASCFINENFVHLSSEQEYLELSETNLRNLIESDDITVPDEACVFEALMTWINHDVENRKQSIGNYFAISFKMRKTNWSLVDLLNSVRLTNIQREYLCNVVEPHSAIRENPTAQRLVIETMKLHICPLPVRVYKNTSRGKMIRLLFDNSK